MAVLPRILIGGVLVAIASYAQAQQQGTDLKKEMIGQWELSTAERGKTCVITLRPENAPQGQRLALEPGCAEALPFTKDVVAWAIRGLDLVRLLDAKGQPVIDFSEVENGILEGMRQGEGVYLLQNLAAARAAQRSMDQMIGDWSVMRGVNRVLCGVTLTNNEATLKDNFQLFLKPRCDAQVANFKPVAWRLERGELLVSAANGDVWRFEADDNAQWRRVPDSADPMLLIRQ
jgi:Protease inhibitor Inh